ncbi:MAG: phosphatase PAP2 family protein [Proteobacteria bacterium]|nr:phosphatase PAP2 family protein [Pseudomonadota bacterium]
MTGDLKAATGRIEARMLLAFLAIVVALVGFAALAAEAREGDIFRIDRVLLLAFRDPGRLDTPVGPRWVREAARDITALGGFTVLTLISVSATAMLLVHRRRLQAAVFAGTVIAAEIASSVLKQTVDRARPELVPHLDLVYSASFPSGHAMMSPVVYLTLAAVLAAGERPRGAKVMLLGGAALLVLAVGISRVYLGVHWPTDVLGGWALGSAIALAASIILVRAAPRPLDAAAIAAPD